MHKLYNKVKGLCDERGISIKRLEVDAGIANGTIGKWRRGYPRLETLYKVSDALEVPVTELLKAIGEESVRR